MRGRAASLTPPEPLYILAYTVLLLSSYQHNPLVRRKMSKREFLRNTRPVLGQHFHDAYLGAASCMYRPVSRAGSVYDYVFLFGHVAGPKAAVPRRAEVLPLAALAFDDF